jgi:hypothetical protein
MVDDHSIVEQAHEI